MRVALKTIAALCGGSVFVLAAGCMSSGKFSDKGMPDRKYQVGGGWTIKYAAPTDGTIYLFEETTGKIIETRTVSKGEKVTYNSTPEEEAQQAARLEKSVGITMKEARQSLFFIPANPPSTEIRPTPQPTAQQPRRQSMSQTGDLPDNRPAPSSMRGADEGEKGGTMSNTSRWLKNVW